MQLAKPDFSNLPKFEKNFYVSIGFVRVTALLRSALGARCSLCRVLARFACSGMLSLAAQIVLF
jgi:hypothetical protein